jgi:hypothetical protein
LFDVTEGVEYLARLSGGVMIPTRRGKVEEERSWWNTMKTEEEGLGFVSHATLVRREPGVVLGFGEDI